MGRPRGRSGRAAAVLVVREPNGSNIRAGQRAERECDAAAAWLNGVEYVGRVLHCVILAMSTYITKFDKIYYDYRLTHITPGSWLLAPAGCCDC